MQSGNTYTYTDRNVFDFGRVINPCYEVVPGEDGGLRNGDNWMHFVDGQGWETTRPLSDEERESYDAVRSVGYHSGSGIRM